MGGFSISSLGTAGPVLLLLAGLSVVSIAVLIMKLLELRTVADRAAERDHALEAGKAPAKDNPANRVVARAVALLDQSVAAGPMERELGALGNAEVGRMARGLRLLELIGMIAPLLGLLGTVLGMIQSFRSLELAEGAANASILAGGIWQALLTTAAGLIVAIPALVGASMVAAQIERGTQEIERVIARALTKAAGRKP